MAEPAQKRVRKPREDPVADTMNYYASKGWTTFRANSITDFVAHKDNKRGLPSVHYVKVVTESNADSADVTGAQRGAFIQNAISNAAVPVYVKITQKTKRDGSVEKTFSVENVNENTQLRLIAKPAETTV